MEEENESEPAVIEDSLSDSVETEDEPPVIQEDFYAPLDKPEAGNSIAEDEPPLPAEEELPLPVEDEPPLPVEEDELPLPAEEDEPPLPAEEDVVPVVYSPAPPPVPEPPVNSPLDVAMLLRLDDAAPLKRILRTSAAALPVFNAASHAFKSPVPPDHVVVSVSADADDPYLR